ncbi:MAG: hypothetical protein PHY43_03935 [Verrucomicrobiales bacterium]|nr:hypothetical protein [Verrucomicrobiales bacterium]
MNRFLTITPAAAERFYDGKKYHRKLSPEQVDAAVKEALKIFSSKFPHVKISAFRRV